MQKPDSEVRLCWPTKREPSRSAGAVLKATKGGHSPFELVLGDNLAALHALRARERRYTLAYLDPPFFTGREHTEVVRTRTQDGAIARGFTRAFDDRWSDLGAYLAVSAERIAAVRDLLEENGCMVLHVDPKTSHYLKIVCDEIFGRAAFASEIVWRYRRWPAKTKNFQRVHDILLRYVKNPRVEPRFYQLYEPLAASTLQTWGKKKQRAVVDESGRRKRSSITEHDTPGAPLGDVWEIGIVAPVARERTGYPTQKPEALLERLIRACTQSGDAVLDPYLGSGTSLAVAARLGRAGTGIDVNQRSIQLTRQRLKQLEVSPRESRLAMGPGTVASADRAVRRVRSVA
jgi:site-specific DNA-methyltransferase (adenine-specific)